MEGETAVVPGGIAAHRGYVMTVAFAVAGYAFSNAVEALLPQIRHYEEYLFAAVLAVGVLIWLTGRVRRAGGRR